MIVIRFIFNLIVKVTGFPVYFLLFRTKVYYQNKKVQSRKIKGSAIVVSNHTSVWDFALMMFLFPFRLLRCVVAKIIYTHFMMTPLLHLFGAIKVDRFSQDYAFVSKGIEVLEKGGVVEIYPEGRIPENEEGMVQTFHPSFVYLALESGAPIIPVFTNGKYFTKERARVIIGEPINVCELYDENLSKKKNVEIISKYIEKVVRDLGYELSKRK